MIREASAGKTAGRTRATPPPEISYEGTAETEEGALAAVWDVVLREKAKREAALRKPPRTSPIPPR